MPTHRDLRTKRSLACHSHPPGWQSGSKRLREEEGMAVGWRVRPALARRFLTLTFLRRQQMRSMFFKRSRCREGKGLDKGGRGAETRAPPTAPRVVARGRQNTLRCLPLRKAAASPWQLSPWRGLHLHLHGNGPEPGKGCPIRRNPSPDARSRCLRGRGPGKGQGHLISPPHRIPFPRPPFPPSTRDRKTNGQTHLSTAHVSLTARAGFPWSMGFLKSVRSSSKAMIWG